MGFDRLSTLKIHNPFAQSGANVLKVDLAIPLFANRLNLFAPNAQL